MIFFYALIFTLLYVWTVCRLSKKQPEPVHLGPCGSPHGMNPIGTQPRILDGIDYTIVLYRCRHCQQHQSLIHHGKWELGDFLRTENDVQELERLGRMMR